MGAVKISQCICTFTYVTSDIFQNIECIWSFLVLIEALQYGSYVQYTENRLAIDTFFIKWHIHEKMAKIKGFERTNQKSIFSSSHLKCTGSDIVTMFFLIDRYISQLHPTENLMKIS